MKTLIFREIARLVETYLRFNGFFTVAGTSNSAAADVRDVDVIALRLPIIEGFHAPAPDAELALTGDAIEIVVGVIEPGHTSRPELPDPVVIEEAIMRLCCCQGDPQTMALTLLRSGRAVSFLHGSRLRTRIVVFGPAAPNESLYETISIDHMTEFVRHAADLEKGARSVTERRGSTSRDRRSESDQARDTTVPIQVTRGGSS